jgi:chromosome segregation ATPase
MSSGTDSHTAVSERSATHHEEATTNMSPASQEDPRYGLLPPENPTKEDIVDQQLIGITKFVEGINETTKRLEAGQVVLANGQRELKEGQQTIQHKLVGVDRRLKGMGKRFDNVDQRFEQVDQRFEQVDQRFEQVGQRLDKIDSKLEVLVDLVKSK